MRGEEFPGLAYFGPDPDYRFVLELREHDEKGTVTVETTADGERTYLRWVPFRDGTNGEETYGAGRYVDLDPDEHRTGDGRRVLDFNEAYNPTCAYNHAYECPLIPMENWLEVRIEAGEKGFPADPAQPHGHHH